MFESVVNVSDFTLVDSIHEQDNPIVESEEVRKFHAYLLKHAREILGLNLAALPLMTYKTPDFELNAKGKVFERENSIQFNVIH